MEQLTLIQQTLDKAYQATDSFEIDPGMSSRLLYLIGAISRDSYVEIDPADEDDNHFLAWLQVHMDWDDLSPYLRPTH
jgi:hypothetical protein